MFEQLTIENRQEKGMEGKLATRSLDDLWEIMECQLVKIQHQREEIEQLTAQLSRQDEQLRHHRIAPAG